MSIPFLAGNTLRDPTRTEFRKNHTFDFTRGFAIENKAQGSDVYLGANVAALAKLGQSKLLSFPKRQVTTFKETVPSWVAYDRQVLRFFGYFKEAVNERADENYRVRKVTVMLFLVDESILVEEPKTENSGIPQGKFIRRHRIPKGRVQDGHFTARDFQLGKDITFYGRTIHIYDCDYFTREFYAANGIELSGSEPAPSDPYSELQDHRLQFKTRKTVSKPEMDKLRQFLQNDRKVLRFFGSWDDRASMFGDMRPFVVNYFLADDTIEVLEVHDANSGRDAFPSFFRRAPLPKTIPGVMVSGAVEYYTPYDLVVGQTLQVYGRSVLLRECDEFTRQYYERQLGIDQSNFVQEEAAPRIDITQPIPPHTGFGTDEDSLGSFYSLVPKPRRKDIQKFMMNDGKILRFAAKMVTQKQEDVDRRFIISYYLADDTASVYETPVANSGIIGGKFLERGPAKLPHQDFGVYPKEAFAVGNVVNFSAQNFLLYDCDAYTKNMLHSPHADKAGLLHHKLGTALMEHEKSFTLACRVADPASTGSISQAELRQILSAHKVNLSDEDFGDLVSFWDPLKSDKVPHKKFVEVIMEAVFTRATDNTDANLFGH